MPFSRSDFAEDRSSSSNLPNEDACECVELGGGSHYFPYVIRLKTYILADVGATSVPATAREYNLNSSMSSTIIPPRQLFRVFVRPVLSSQVANKLNH